MCHKVSPQQGLEIKSRVLKLHTHTHYTSTIWEISPRRSFSVREIRRVFRVSRFRFSFVFLPPPRRRRRRSLAFPTDRDKLVITLHSCFVSNAIFDHYAPCVTGEWGTMCLDPSNHPRTDAWKPFLASPPERRTTMLRSVCMRRRKWRVHRRCVVATVVICHLSWRITL